MKTIYWVRTHPHMIGRIAWDRVREAKARNRTETTPTLPKATT